MNANGGGNTADIVAGIVWAVGHGANVINMSLGSRDSDKAEEAAIRWARNRESWSLQQSATTVENEPCTRRLRRQQEELNRRQRSGHRRRSGAPRGAAPRSVSEETPSTSWRPACGCSRPSRVRGFLRLGSPAPRWRRHALPDCCAGHVSGCSHQPRDVPERSSGTGHQRNPGSESRCRGRGTDRQYGSGKLTPPPHSPPWAHL